MVIYLYSKVKGQKQKSKSSNRNWTQALSLPLSLNWILDKPNNQEPKITTIINKHTYESPRNSWNLIVPVVVSASKSGNTSPSSSPGMFSVTVEVFRLFSCSSDDRQREIKRRRKLPSQHATRFTIHCEVHRTAYRAWSDSFSAVRSGRALTVWRSCFQVFQFTNLRTRTARFPTKDLVILLKHFFTKIWS